MITGTYNLSATSASQIPLQQLFLECDTTLAPVTINLFQIADIQRQWSLKIYISDATNTASLNNITINCALGDHINAVGTSSVVLNSNGSGVTITISSDTLWLATSGVSSGGGGSSVVDIDYADLYTAIVNETLTTGTMYRLRDYRSVNFINGYNTAVNNPLPIDANFDPRELYTSDPESILLTAISPYELSPIGISEKYSGDIVEFQAYTNAIGLPYTATNGVTLPNLSILSGFDLQWDVINNWAYFDMPSGFPLLFGQYLYLYMDFDNGVDTYTQDGEFAYVTPHLSRPTTDYSGNISNSIVLPMSNLIVTDNGTKVILSDLTLANYNDYVANSLYIETIYYLADAYGFVSRRTDTFNNIIAPTDFRNFKYRRWQNNLSSVAGYAITGYYGITDNDYGVGTTGLYRDSLIFADGFYHSNVFINGQGTPSGGYFMNSIDNTIFQDTTANVEIQAPCESNTFLRVFDTKIAPNCSGNTMSGLLQFSEIGQNFSQNIMRNFSYSKTDSGFNSNYIRDILNSEIGLFVYSNTGRLITNCTFGGNAFGNTFGSTAFGQNVCGWGFYNNIFSAFSSNSDNFFGDEFHDNTFNSGCLENKFERGGYNNSFSSLVTQNVFTSSCFQNTLQSVVGNNVQGRFENNDISGNFNNNIIFGQCIGNTITGALSNNNILKSFSGNEIGDAFSLNTINQTFDNNQVANGFQKNTIFCSVTVTDFLLATYVYQSGNKSIFERSDGSQRLSYVDNSNTVIYQSINA